MNHIVRLQTELSNARAELDAKAEALQAFRVHLHTAKFASPGPGGERRDWIATSDVLAWLSNIVSAGTGA